MTNKINRRLALQKIVLCAGVAALIACGSGQTPTAKVESATQAPTAKQEAVTKALATPTKAAEKTGGEITVTYTDSGYDPAEIKVKVGDTVVFKNESSKQMWTASDPHPVHTDLPGFDSKKGITKGESYSYTFTKAGTWGYHNHLNPGHTGKVIVE